ncbi:MAG: tetratricopeptide repeat protein [Phenylobacterium sp.]|uniref:tetratricopeptide repeat protein n=1 Tax=Phenylobacterium sp. TaxID=1871053 RepID=UPI00391C9734
MVDLFEEVEEQLRSDRYKSLALKAVPWIAGLLALALVVALGVWGWQAYNRRAHTQASETYAQAMEAFGRQDREAAMRLWGEVAQSPSKGYKTLALMQQGGVSQSEGKTEAAVKFFDEAAKAAPNPLLADAARLKSALALLDTAPYKEMEARLTPLTEEGRPYRAQAREALAFAKLMAGNVAGAREDFVIIRNMLDAQEGARQRAAAAIELIDSGGAKGVPAAVKAAASLPPASAPSAGGASAPQQQAPGPQ